MTRVKRIAIIGGGPAGIFGALWLKDFKGEVHLFEQNKDIGEKLKLTGGGRMNLCNKVFSDQEFSSSSKNLYKKIFKNPHAKNPEKMLQGLGLDFFWEKNRAILSSEDAIGEVQRLKNQLKEQPNTHLHLNTKIQAIRPEPNGLTIRFNDQEETFDYVILTTGGMYRIGDLGSKEKIYHLPLQLGHTLTPLAPSLCPLLFSDARLKKYAGIAFEGALTDERTQKSVQNDLLITHFGLSGPAALDFSALRESDQISLQFVTSISEKTFIQSFNQKRDGKNAIRKFLKTYLPQRLVDFHLQNSDIAENFMADIPKAKLQKLTQSLFHYPLPKLQPNAYPSSWTTKGGIPLEEIQTHTLESKRQPNVFLAGEVLDIDGLCGGYNISFAAISARIVVDAVLKKSHA